MSPCSYLLGKVFYLGSGLINALNQCMEWWKTWGHGSWLQKLLLSMMHYIHWNEIKRSTVNYGDLQFSSRREDFEAKPQSWNNLKTKGTISFIKHCLFHLIRSCHEKKKWMVPKPWRVLRNYHCTSIQIKRWWKELVKFVSLWSYIIIFVLQITFSWVTQVLTRISSQNLKCHSGNSFSGAQPWGPVQCGLRVCRRQAHPPLVGVAICHCPPVDEGAQQTRANVNVILAPVKGQRFNACETQFYWGHYVTNPNNLTGISENPHNW